MKHAKAMVKCVQEYLDHRRSLGSQLLIEGQQLLRFGAYADSIGHKGPVTVDLALRWARLPENATPLYWARRLEVVRCFARYQAIFDSRTEIPPERILGSAHRRTTPHIFSDCEIAKLMTEAEKLTPANGLRPRTYATLLGLLACTGLRIMEALRLAREDVDLEAGILTIRETKFHKSRLVPLHPSTTLELRSYARFRDRRYPETLSPAFLLAERGGALKYSTVRITFRKLCRCLDWKPTADRRYPRLYDLRHTFATQRLLQWYRDGVDVEHAISTLSTYLGHVKVTDTYWYITAIPELLSICADRFEHFAYPAKGGRR